MDIKDMTLEQKIGQMIMAGFESDTVDEHARKIMTEYKIGNIVLFARNVKDKYGAARLCRGLQEAAVSNTGIPAFISIDQEGGMVTRIQKGATFFPGNMAFSAAGDDEYTETEGRIEGRELRAMGINVDLAPVLDVNNNSDNPVIGVRSYGDVPERVASLGKGFVRGLQKSMVVATAKHFPGHGDTAVDSHLDLPCVSHPMDRLEAVELYPFVKAIESGVDAVMSAHILFPAIEGEKLPGTLSYKVLTGLLREKMGFRGIVITDCMEMNAIKTFFGTPKAAVMAVKAGADIICISHTMDLQIESAVNIKNAVLSGEIPESRIDESVNRIINMKRKYGLFENPYPDMDKVESVVGCESNMEFAEGVSMGSITLLRDSDGLLPVKPGKVVSISTEPLVLTGADDMLAKRRGFSEAVREALGGEAYIVPLNPDDDVIGSIAEKCRDAQAVIVGTYNANLNKGQAKLVNRIYEVNKETIVVSLRNPYDILMFKQIPSYICAYEYTPLSVRSAVKVLTGETSARGKLPVKITF